MRCTLSIRNIEAEILNYLTERGWDKLRPSDLAKSILIEASEHLEVFQWGSYELEETNADQKNDYNQGRVG